MNRGTDKDKERKQEDKTMHFDQTTEDEGLGLVTGKNPIKATQKKDSSNSIRQCREIAI